MKIVIFCGGVGSRMWPMSRKSKPKQFQKLIGDQTMFQQTVKRIRNGFPVNNIFVSTGKEYVKLIREQAPEIPKQNIIIEPMMRDNTAAVGYALVYLNKKYPDSLMAAIWGADHIVKNEDTFVNALKAAQGVCQKKQCIVKVDVNPTFPSTQLGYVKIGKTVGEINGFQIFEFKKHCEKPDLKTAKKFLESWGYLWNTGYFVWPVNFALNLYKKYSPKNYRVLKKIENAIGSSSFKTVLQNEYPKIEKRAIDYVIFEKLDPKEQLVIPADLGWADVGAWNVLKDQLSNNSENIESGLHIGIDTKNSLIYAPSKKLVATVGLKDMIIVDTTDALLVCPKDRAADVKNIVKTIEEKELKKYL